MQQLMACELLGLGIINDPYHLKLIMMVKDALTRHEHDFNSNLQALSSVKMMFPLL